METNRRALQGLSNIIRFNWHFYALTSVLCMAVLVCNHVLGYCNTNLTTALIILIMAPVLTSLLVSWYVYDLSGFYALGWLDKLNIRGGKTILNIHAGFDESSVLLRKKHHASTLTVLDFYDSRIHTEVSIKRARKAYPQYPGTLRTSTQHLQLADESVETVFVIFSAHEIRNLNERVAFFSELKRVLMPGGKIVVTEHLRDFANFMAYNIGFFHFLPAHEWKTTFASSGLIINTERRINPFVTSFILQKS